MRLKLFEVKSYRSCLDTKLNFSSNLTSLIGPNGTGKSNILNAVLLLKKLSNSSSKGYFHEPNSPYNKCSIKVELETEGKVIKIKGDISFETDEKNYDEITNVDLTWDLSEILDIKKDLKIPISVLSHQDYLFDSGLYFDFVKWKKLSRRSLIEKALPSANTVIKFFNRITYYGATQFSDPSRCPNFVEIEDGRPVRRVRSFGHEKFITDLYYAKRANNKKEYDNFINTVNKNGIGLLDSILFKEITIPSSSIEVLSGGQIKKKEKNRILVVPTFIIDNNKLSPNQLSEGTFRTLALLFYLLTDDSDLVLIEEPEVCVHHGLLSSIVALIKSQSKYKQIIISTHSDYVLDQLEPENVILVDRSSDKGTVAMSLKERLKGHDYTALKDYLSESGNLGEYWKESGFE